MIRREIRNEWSARMREVEPKRAYVVVREGAAVLELLAGKDEALLVGRDALLVLNFRLHIVDGIRRLDLRQYSD